MERCAIDVVKRTISNQSADPVGDLTQKGQEGPKANSLESVTSVVTKRSIV